MRQTICGPTGLPTAFIALNKSRIKLYHKETSPTYYLNKGTEFMIELFNPTSDTVLAKIHLNGTAIAQGGLVLRPGERVFLERYVDIAKKFLFDTYEVSNTKEVRKAIEDNGDLKVEFYRESKPYYGYLTTNTPTYTYNNYHNYSNPFLITTCGTSTGVIGASTLTGGGGSSISFNASSANCSYTSGISGSLSCSDSLSDNHQTNSIRSKRSIIKSKSIETGRVEAGASSNQKLEFISKTFDSYSFHTVEYKLLPLSQKVNTTEDLNVKRYCTSCGSKQKEGYKFCPNCGSKA